MLTPKILVMPKSFLVLILLSLSNFLYSQKEAYAIFNADGEKVNYDIMLDSMQSNDIILFGEQHNNPIAHWLQYEFTADLHKRRKLILGAEMLEADNQEVLTQYIQDSISYEGLDTLARLWSNYKTDYAPLVDFAKEKELPFIATNIPRRYASMVYHNDFPILDTLSAEEKAWIAPLPIKFDSELPRYKYIFVELGEHASIELVKAQAIKDATMAHFILKNYLPEHLFVHYNGAYHSDFHEGILWYLQGENPDLKYGTITTVSQESLDKLEESHIGRADFIICVDSDMTTTY